MRLLATTSSQHVRFAYYLTPPCVRAKRDGKGRQNRCKLGFHFPHDQSHVGNGSRVREVFHWQMPIAMARCNAISI